MCPRIIYKFESYILSQPATHLMFHPSFTIKKVTPD
jgi:hypothetical protein